MTASRKLKSIASFPPEFFDIWNLALEGKLNLTLPTKGMATNFRQRLYTFRRLLMTENPTQASPMYQTDLLVTEIEGKGLLTSHIPEWKLQVRAAIEKIEPCLPVPVPTASNEAVQQTLEKLGFYAK